MRIPFLQFIETNRVYLDGAFGSELIVRGVDTDNAPLLNLTNPDVVKSIHDGYIKAGSDVIFSNTFGANALKLSGCGAALSDVIEAGVKIARQSAGADKYVAYDCSPLGELLRPFGNLTFEEAYGYFAEQAKIIKDLDIDFVAIETMTDLLELKAAILAFQENTNFPVACSMSFDEKGRTFTGAGVGPFALTVQGLGVCMMGINCGIGPDLLLDDVKELVKYAHIPVFVKANAGMPEYVNGRTSYDMSAGLFAEHMKNIAAEGISVLGGCCGTSPEYIQKLIAGTSGMPLVKPNNFVDAVCSASEVVRFEPTIVIGEKINPTGRPPLKQAYRDENWDYIVSLAVEQTGQGAQILDINAGMPGIDETAVLAETVQAVQGVVSVPLQIDSSRAKAVEAALRVSNGVPIINSVNGEAESMENIFPLAQRYGAYIVALCMDENGVPDTVEGRLNAAKKILAGAERHGIKKERLLFDSLTLAVSVDGSNPSITKETSKRLRDEFGVKTVVGLSNVSFGLPARGVINAEFYRQLKEEKVTACIIDPMLKPVHNELAERALGGQDAQCAEFISAYADYKPDEGAVAGDNLYAAVRRGIKGEAVAAVAKFVNAENFLQIIKDDIIRALNDLGNDYEKGIVFLPQLIAGAESAKAALKDISDKYMSDNPSNRATILLATVKGDVHDIGKNIVKAVLGNYGYKIIDLGKDVGAEAVLAAIKKHNAAVVGLSALMTTTLDNMAHITSEIKKAHSDVIVITGGAVVTPAFSEQIGADMYCKDAQDCVRKLDVIFPQSTLKGE